MKAALASQAPEAAYSQEEFASVTIVIDHLANLEGRTVVKTVWSTEAADEALLSQVTYFNQTGLLVDDGVRAMVAVGEAQDVAYVYHVDERHTQIIADLSVWTKAFADPNLGNNTVLGTCAAFMTMATEMQKAANAAGEGSTILLFKPE